MLTGNTPFGWQRRLFADHFGRGDVPSAVDIPTGLGKTSVIVIWLLAIAWQAQVGKIALPRRLVYVVDRRAVVDQATTEAETLRDALEGKADHFDRLDATAQAQALQIVVELKRLLGFDGAQKLPISTLRGAHVDNREWLDDPTVPAIIVGTVDMIGSRLLFSGYGVSRKERPYHAGLLGSDALVVLDEAHLVPSFAHLLRAIEQDTALWPEDEVDRALVPRFVVLPLSATQRDSGDDKRERAPFRLKDEDWMTDCDAKKRLEARKRLRFCPLAEKEHDKQLAKVAWDLARKDGRFFRVVVFCERRDKKEDGAWLSAQGVKDEIEKLAKPDKKAGRPRVEIDGPELLVGARRVYEREKVERRLRDLGFIGKKKTPARPTFLVATSAGEVGVDIDADHMVSDLVAWERMVQRLGRVNRRGEGDAEIQVFWCNPSIKDAKAPNESEKRAQTAFASKAVIESLSQIDGAFDASPGALRQLAERAHSDAALKALIESATTPEPLRPALTRALVDAWSMTSLEEHTGRPKVAPWLRGWVDDVRQTIVVWRTYLPIREGIDEGQRTAAEKKEIEDFFEAAPPHESEKLETETHRVVDWLQARADDLLKRKRHVSQDDAESEGADSDTADSERSAADDADNEEPATLQANNLGRRDIVALILSPSGSYEESLALGDLAYERKGKAQLEFQDKFVGKTLIIDARFGGLRDGLLELSSDSVPETADHTNNNDDGGWSKKVQFRVRKVKNSDGGEPRSEQQNDEWYFEDKFVIRRDGEGNPLEWLEVEHFKGAAQKEDARSVAKPQELAVHQDWARSEMIRLAKAAGLSEAAADALAVAAGLHDEGKKASRWQRAFKAPRDAKKYSLSGPLAKTRGPIDQAILDGYRHEFGSLLAIEENAEFKALPEDWRELLLHLVAAHHGQARPVIETRGCEDGPPSLLEERACTVALRFARLQKRWGPWGLAWWEALMRAADRRASRANDERPTLSAKGSS